LNDEVINSYDGHDGVVGWVCVGKKQEKERIAAMVRTLDSLQGAGEPER
jgi:hypothetical protein